MTNPIQPFPEPMCVWQPLHVLGWNGVMRSPKTAKEYFIVNSTNAIIRNAMLSTTKRT